MLYFYTALLEDFTLSKEAIALFSHFFGGVYQLNLEKMDQFGSYSEARGFYKMCKSVSMCD